MSNGLLVPEILPAVHLPESYSKLDEIKNLLDLNVPASVAVVNFIARSGGTIKSVGDKEKFPADGSNSLQDIQDMVIELVLHQNQHSIDIHNQGDYNHFPHKGSMKLAVETFVQTNPFMASALEVVMSENGSVEGFQINSHTAGGCIEEKSSWYTLILETLQGKDHKVNAVFSRNLELVSVEQFSDEDGSSIRSATISNSSDMEYLCSSLLFNLIFYASCVHGTLHVLHFLMGACIVDVAKGTRNDNLRAWAEPFNEGLAIKYQEVHLLLIADKKKSPDETILTGDAGFGGNQKTRYLCKQMLLQWGSCTTAFDFLSKFLLRGISANLPDESPLLDVLKSAGCLEEYLKHMDIIPRYADELCEFFTDADSTKAEVDKGIEKFLGDTGLEEGDLQLTSFSAWLHIMSVTGLLHGGTLSYTRLIAVPDVLRWRDIDNPKWDSADLNLMTGGLGTIVGMQDERHVFSASIQYENLYNGEKKHPKLVDVLGRFGDHVPGIVRGGVEAVRGAINGIRERIFKENDSESTHTDASFLDGVNFWINTLTGIPAITHKFHLLLEKFDDETSKLKKEYQDRLEEDTSRLNELGWILTDYCEDGCDGKQLTLATYI